MTTRTARIRQARQADAPALARISVDVWRESYGGLLPERVMRGIDLSHRLRRFSARLGNPRTDTATFVAEIDDVAVGYGICGPRRSGPADHKGEFHELYVLSQAQRGGLGGALMQVMAGWLQSRDLEPAMVWVLESNTVGRRFYERLGGRWLGAAEIAMEGEPLVEVAYGWADLDPLVLGGVLAAEIEF